MKQKVAVTGATGFLGEYVVKELCQQNYEVVAIGRNQKRLEYLSDNYQVESLILDLTDEKKVKKLWPSGLMGCLHCAALSTVYGDYQSFYKANVLATKYAIEASIRAGLKRFVLVSSPSIYSKRQDDFNIKEKAIDEFASKEKCLNYYIASKIEAEKLVKNYKKKIEIVVIRPRGLFGVGDTSIFPRLMKVNHRIGIPLFRKGKGNTMDITCVENVAYALRLCLEKDGIDQYIFNITNDEPVNFKELIQKIFSLLGEEVRFRKLNATAVYYVAAFLERVYQILHIKKEPLLTRYTVGLLAYSQTLDITLAKKKLGYAPIMTIDQGIKKYIQTVKKR